MKIAKFFWTAILIWIICINVVEVPPVVAMPDYTDQQKSALSRIGDPFVA